MRSKGNDQKNGEPTVRFSLTTILQHTGRFWSRFSQQEQYTNTETPPYPPDMDPADFYLFLGWNLHWRDGAFVMLLTSLRMRRKSWKGFYYFDVCTVNFVQFIIQTNKCTTYTGCNRRNVREFGRVFIRSNYTDITQNTYIQSWTVTEILAGEVWNFDSYYSLIDYQIHIETGRDMWFL